MREVRETTGQNSATLSLVLQRLDLIEKERAAANQTNVAIPPVQMVAAPALLQGPPQAISKKKLTKT